MSVPFLRFVQIKISSSILCNNSYAVTTVDYIDKTAEIRLVECCNIQFVYEGVSFLNEDQEKAVQRHIGNGEVSTAADRYYDFFLLDYQFF